jgi:putative oxidoreductase
MCCFSPSPFTARRIGAANKDEFGFFVDHFTFIAGLLFAAAYGPGQALAFDRRWIRR